MNGRQKIVVVGGLFLALLCVLFPPWEGSYFVPGNPDPSFSVPARLQTRRLGRYFLFDPPTQADAFEAITGQTAQVHRPGDRQLSLFRVQVIYAEATLQGLVVVLGVAGVAVLLSERKPSQ